jgi:pyruvate/2-oxoglutarate dehydrogenase complex dihydrolipoamide dehydrogenase (E3) component
VIRRVAANEQVYVEGVTVRFGNSSFASPHELLLNGERFTSRNIVIATGSHPLIPSIEGLEEVGYLTNEDALTCGTSRPRSLPLVADPSDEAYLEGSAAKSNRRIAQIILSLRR